MSSEIPRSFSTDTRLLASREIPRSSHPWWVVDILTLSSRTELVFLRIGDTIGVSLEYVLNGCQNQTKQYK